MRWEIYENTTYVGIRNVETGAAVARIPLTVKDLQAVSQLIAAAPLLRETLQGVLDDQDNTLSESTRARIQEALA